MGYRHYACVADTVSEDFVKKICPDEFSKLEKCLKEHESTFYTISEAVEREDIVEELTCSWDIEEEQAQEIETLWNALETKFKEVTEGLRINLIHYDSEAEGEDIEDGYSWEVCNVYQLTPAGERFKDEIRRKSWVVGG